MNKWNEMNTRARQNEKKLDVKQAEKFEMKRKRAK